MAFQMYDDILNLFGDTRETGKPKGNDIKRGDNYHTTYPDVGKNEFFKTCPQLCRQNNKGFRFEKLTDEIISSGG